MSDAGSQFFSRFFSHCGRNDAVPPATEARGLAKVFTASDRKNLIKSISSFSFVLLGIDKRSNKVTADRMLLLTMLKFLYTFLGLWTTIYNQATSLEAWNKAFLKSSTTILRSTRDPEHSTRRSECSSAAIGNFQKTTRENSLRSVFPSRSILKVLNPVTSSSTLGSSSNTLSNPCSIQSSSIGDRWARKSSPSSFRLCDWVWVNCSKTNRLQLGIEESRDFKRYRQSCRRDEIE